jgi:hypothetical protein
LEISFYVGIVPSHVPIRFLVPWALDLACPSLGMAMPAGPSSPTVHGHCATWLASPAHETHIFGLLVFQNPTLDPWLDFRWLLAWEMWGPKPP